MYMDEHKLPKNVESLEIAWLAVKKEWFDKAEAANAHLARICADNLVKKNNTEMMYTDDWREDREA